MAEERRCPMCGRLNPADAEACGHCGARLTFAGADAEDASGFFEDAFSTEWLQRGETGPTTPPPMTDDTAWLRGFFATSEAGEETLDDMIWKPSDAEDAALEPPQEAQDPLSEWMGEPSTASDEEKASEPLDDWFAPWSGDAPGPAAAEPPAAPHPKAVSEADAAPEPTQDAREVLGAAGETDAGVSSTPPAEAEVELPEDWVPPWASDAKRDDTARADDASPPETEAEVGGWPPPWLDQAPDEDVREIPSAAKPEPSVEMKDTHAPAEEASSFEELVSFEDRTGELALSEDEIEALLGHGAGEPPPVPEELLNEAQAQKPAASGEEAEPLDRAHVPEWLRRAAPAAETPSAPSVVEEILERAHDDADDVSEALVGIPDVLPLVSEVAQPEARPRAPLTLRLTRSQEQRAQWLQELLQAEKQPRILGKPWVTLRFGWLRALVGAALIVAVVLLAVSPRRFHASPAPHPAWQAAFTAVETLPPHAPVLLVVDASWATAPEVRRVAQPLLLHLAHKQPDVVQVATAPWGVGVLTSPPETSSPWMDLGYMPGGVVWLAQLSRALPYALTGGARPWPPQDLAGWQSVQTVAQTRLVVVVTDSPEHVRQWAEQVAPHVGNDSGLVFVLSQQAGPWAEPYLTVPGVRGGLVGIEAGLAYAQALGVDVSPDLALWSRYQGAWVLATVLLIVAAIGAGLLQRVARRSSDTSTTA